MKIIKVKEIISLEKGNVVILPQCNGTVEVAEVYEINHTENGYNIIFYNGAKLSVSWDSKVIVEENI